MDYGGHIFRLRMSQLFAGRALMAIATIGVA